MPKVQANGINIYYETHGCCDPLALISGLGYDHWQWSKMVPGLARHFQVIVFDNRGAGESDKPAGPYVAQMLADDTVALLEALGHTQAFVMGHSMGGYVAQALVLGRPDMVRKLVLSSTNFGGPRQIPVTSEAMAVITDTQSDPIERLRRGIAISTAPGWAEAHPEIIQEWLDYRRQHPVDLAGCQAQIAIGLALKAEDVCFEPKLKDIKAPILILFGEHDKVVPPGNAELLAKEIPDSKVVILPNAGHFYPFDAADAAVEAVVEFLKA